ncbi:MAG TPA: tetrahydrofolate dehydrogenase/cyclohydrolase catalytic domain-containing protein, partial [Gammaproteobacteria bacterium]|nr:tetrahydrofolate dehydrogenase/cyclohydrolase catalytic domain-containing protein [Gammaproteobacteria bacterium]
MATIIDGKAFSANLRGEIARKVEYLKNNHSLVPGLAVVLVGEDPASQVYVRSKGKQTVEAGMNSYEHKLDASTSQKDLLVLIDRLNKDPDVHGILVQLPLPKHIDEETVVNSVSVDKDVDGFHLSNVGRLATGADGIVPCTPLGSLMMLKDQLGDLSGMKA